MHDDGEAERGDREIVATQANREHRQGHSGRARQHDAEQERHPERHAELHDEQRRDVGADAIERRMAEVELTGIAENEIEPDGQHHVERANDQVRAPVGVLKDDRQTSRW